MPQGSKIDPTLRAAVFSAIDAHIKEKGPAQYNLLFQRFPEIPRRTFFKWIAEVRDGPDDVLRKTEARRRKHQKGIGVQLADAALPPTPDWWLAVGRFNDEKVNWLAVLNMTLYDAMMLRERGVKRDPETGVESVLIPAIFDSSIKRRVELVKQAVTIQRDLFDLDKLAGFYRGIAMIIMEEIGELHPEVRNRILLRLKQLNEEHMMST